MDVKEGNCAKGQSVRLACGQSTHVETEPDVVLWLRIFEGCESGVTGQDSE